MNDDGAQECPACRSKSSTQWTSESWFLPDTNTAFTYLQCDDCGAIYSSPRPTTEQLRTFYATHYNFRWFEQHRQFKRVQAWDRWRRCRRWIANRVRPRVLDIGCGHGFFLSEAQRSGYEAIGIDYPSAATRYASKTLKVLEGDFIEIATDQRETLGQFDLITAWHCIEHLPSPRDLLIAAAPLLRTNGLILIAVPNAVCPGMRHARERWVWCQEPFVHTVHFSPNALRFAIENSGLHVNRMWSRDTWDANHLFDLKMKPAVTQLARQVEKISGRAAFWGTEAARLVSYSLGNPRHWLLGQESPPDAGAELIALAQR